MNPRPVFLSVLFFLPFIGCATQYSPGDAEREIASGNASRRLSQLVDAEEAGIDLLPQQERERLLAQARGYVEFKTNRKLSRAQRKQMVDHCAENEDDNIFCEYVIGDGAPRLRGKRVRTPRHPFSLTTLMRGLKKQSVDLPEGLQLRDVGRALKPVSKMDRMDPYFEALKDYPVCLPPAIFTGFGIKAEEGFPDERYRQYALSLYAKAAECGDDESAIQASYRLGLMYVWNKRYAEAEKVLVRVSEHPKGDVLLSRALFWRQFSARQMKNEALEEEMRLRLVREFPLSIHGLLANTDEGLNEFKIIAGSDPVVHFRSATRPDLNPIVMAAEALHRIGFANLSDRILEPLLEQLEGAEPSFQLYLAVLFKRNGDTIRKFQLIAQIVRNDPMMISKQTLEMLYPLSIFELVRIHEEKIDPYVVISLIRQESAFNARAKSPAGAMGLMQVMPRTARMFTRGARKTLYDPQINVKVGVAFFARLLKRYGGDVELALAAYNCGPERVDRWVKRYPIENRMLFLDLLPIRETREYVASIARNYYWYLRLYQKDLMEERLSGNPSPRPVPVGASDRPGAFFNVFGKS